MAYQLIENNQSDVLFVDGMLIPANAPEAAELFLPCYDTVYYETVRVYKGVLLFLEDHLARLEKSVRGGERFPVDITFIKYSLENYLGYLKLGEYHGNMRIVLTRDHIIYHLCDASIPTPDKFEQGIVTNILDWERKAPNIKVFRGDYKEAVAQKFTEDTPFGKPYEVLLRNKFGKLTEGSKSNFFAIVKGEVYSATNDVILIGITRQYVLQALKEAGKTLRYRVFSLEELERENAALFVSSTPFDILPISSVDGVKFDSVNNEVLQSISARYKEIVEDYYKKHV